MGSIQERKTKMSSFCQESNSFFSHVVGAKPDEPHGDPAARVLALHQPAGEAHSAADPGDLAPQRQEQVNARVAAAGII